jgi:hypothetical protein
MLIHPQVVLSAAHCHADAIVFDRSKTKDPVPVTQVLRRPPIYGQSTLPIEQVDFRNDVALFVLAKPVCDLQPFQLGAPPHSGEKLTFIGYGGASEPRRAQGEVVAQGYQSTHHIRVRALGDSEFIPGDSGGPLLRGERITGVFSMWLSSEGEKKTEGSFASVAEFIPDIKCAIERIEKQRDATDCFDRAACPDGTVRGFADGECHCPGGDFPADIRLQERKGLAASRSSTYSVPVAQCASFPVRTPCLRWEDRYELPEEGASECAVLAKDTREGPFLQGVELGSWQAPPVIMGNQDYERCSGDEDMTAGCPLALPAPDGFPKRTVQDDLGYFHHAKLATPFEGERTAASLGIVAIEGLRDTITLSRSPQSGCHVASVQRTFYSCGSAEFDGSWDASQSLRLGNKAECPPPDDGQGGAGGGTTGSGGAGGSDASQGSGGAGGGCPSGECSRPPECGANGCKWNAGEQRCDCPEAQCLYVHQTTSRYSSPSMPTDGTWEGWDQLYCAPRGEPLRYCIESFTKSDSGMDPEQPWCGSTTWQKDWTQLKIDFGCDGFPDYWTKTRLYYDSTKSLATSRCPSTRDLGSTTFWVEGPNGKTGGAFTSVMAFE